MSREIKFRAWDKERKIYVPQGEIILKDYGDTYFEVSPNCQEYIYDKCHNGEPQHNRFAIEQYIGLKDKKGVEIFEGDIMNYGLVVFENGCFGIKDENNCFISFNDVNLCFYEIIGNIHENPELLNHD